MKIATILFALVLATTGTVAYTVTNYTTQEVVAAKAKKPKKPKEPKKPKAPKKVPCACVCAGTLGGTKWDCSPSGCSTKHGTPCSAGGPSQSPTKIQPAIK